MNRLNYSDYAELYKNKILSYANTLLIEHHAKLYIVYLSIFIEWIFTKHHIEQGLSMQDIVDAGIEESMMKAIHSVKNEDIATSLLFCYVNSPFQLKFSMLEDAYKEVVELYKRFSIDNDIVKKEVLKNYDLKVFEERKRQIQRIFEKCPDQIVMEYLNKLNLGNNKKFCLSKKEIKIIKKSLIEKLDDLIVIDLKVDYEQYLQKQRDKELKEKVLSSVTIVQKEGVNV